MFGSLLKLKKNTMKIFKNNFLKIIIRYNF